MRPPLPIDAHLPEIGREIQSRCCVTVKALPGAGKTTRVPVYVASLPQFSSGLWIVVQPRRVAARSTAQRMAQETGTPLGADIGYQIRFERRFGRNTRVLVVTEGVLIRKLLEDPFLENVAGVILDEFHERRLDSDLAIAMLRRIQQTVRPDLRLIVMSATFDTARLTRYLENSTVVECQTPVFPVAVEYCSLVSDERLIPQMRQGIERLSRLTPGHLLAFLPGVGEIRQLQRELSGSEFEREWQIMPLYGDLSSVEQDRVFQETERRKVILATNVAETSITIPGVTGVIDSGLARVSQFDPGSGVNRLSLVRISQASADQRAGRAGRTGPGICLRMWAEAAHRTRAAYETPEIHRVDLSAAVLQLRAWGEKDLTRFPWFEPPAPVALATAETLLKSLGACTDEELTTVGAAMAEIPLQPRLARIVMEGEKYRQRSLATLAAAMLSERDPFRNNSGRIQLTHHSESDVWDRVECLLAWRKTGRVDFDLGTLHADAARRIFQLQHQLEDQRPKSNHTAPSDDTGPVVSPPQALGQSLLAGYPDRLVKRREPRSPRGVMVGGRGTRLLSRSAVRSPDLYLAIDADVGDKEIQVRLASQIQREWLRPPQLTTSISVEFDVTSGRVQARQRTCWFDLILEETPASISDENQVVPILVEAALQNWNLCFPSDNRELSQFLERVACLRDWYPDVTAPDWTLETLRPVVEQLAYGCRSLAELKRADWLNLLRAELTAEQRQILDRELPERIQVPSGSQLAIEYAAGKPPVLAVRIQEIFGWKQTPRIAGGRIPLLLQLLAPNHRPQQITDDLHSFWTTAYQQIRGELHRRYPKHAWPEDPWTAVAERRPQRKSR